MEIVALQLFLGSYVTHIKLRVSIQMEKGIKMKVTVTSSPLRHKGCTRFISREERTESVIVAVVTSPPGS